MDHAFLVLTAVTFSLFGFIIGIWADSFEKLQIIPLLIVTPLTFLGGSFYSVNMLPPFWQTVTLFNPVVYLVSGLPLELLRTGGRQPVGEYRHDQLLPRGLPRDGVVDFQDGLPAKVLTRQTRIFPGRFMPTRRSNNRRLTELRAKMTPSRP